MRRKPILIVTAAVLAAFLVLAGAVVAYDRSRENVIADGVTVAGIDVGGLTRGEATGRLQRRLVAGLRREVLVHHDRSTWRLGAREARIAINLEAIVDEALEVSREGGIVSRTLRNLTGGDVDRDVEPQVTYSKPAVVRMLDKIRSGIERKPVDATVKIDGSGIARKPARTGLRVRASELHRQIRAAIVSPTAPRRFVARTEKVQPKVTDDELATKYGTVIIVNRSAFKLTLYKGLKPAKTYGIAVGKVGMDTPAGLYNIQNKAVNPAWHVPDSDWAGELRGKVIPPGPDNPIKARWMGIYDGAGIHGTADEGSIGSAASHGCIRMRIPEVVELYDRVPVGAPVYIA